MQTSRVSTYFWQTLWKIELVEVTQIFHSDYCNYSFKTLVVDLVQTDLQKQAGYKQAVEVWTSKDGQRPYSKTLYLQLKDEISRISVHNFLMGIIFVNSNNLYLINLASNDQLSYSFPINFANPDGLYLSNQYAFVSKEQRLLWVYDIMNEDTYFLNERINLNNNNSSQLDISYIPRNNDYLLHKVSFNKDYSKIRFKTLKLNGFLLSVFADDDKAVIIVSPNQQGSHADTENFFESIERRSKEVASFSGMLALKGSSKMEKTSVSQVDVTTSTVNLLKLGNSNHHTVDYESVAKPFKQFRMNPCTRFEIILALDSDNRTKIYIVEKKFPQGFRVLELDGEVITPLIDMNHELNDWHFQHDSSRLILQFFKPSGQEVVKVFPLKEVSGHAFSYFAGDQGINQHINMIEQSQFSYQEEILTCLDGKVPTINSFITHDNLLFVGHGNIVSAKNLSSLCFNDTVWKHLYRKYEALKQDTLHYKSFAQFEEDVHYFYQSGSNLLAQYQDDNKVVIQVKKDQIKASEISTMEHSHIIKVHEMITIKGSIYLLNEVLDAITGEKILACVKSDFNNQVSRPAFTVQIQNQEKYAVILNRNSGLVAILYSEVIKMYKVSNFKNEPFQSIEIHDQLNGLDLTSISTYQISEKFIYILSNDLLHIINLKEERVEEPQKLGTNVRHFLIFDDSYIYWLEKGVIMSSVHFDYFNPLKQTKLISCMLFRGANQLNKTKMLRYDEATQRLVIMFSGITVKTFPLLHLPYIELLGYDKIALKKNTELTLLFDKKLYLVSEENFLKVWDLESTRLIKNEYYSKCNYSSYVILQKIDRSIYFLSKPVDQSFHEYLTIEMKVKNNKFIIEELQKFIFYHQACSSSRGTYGKHSTQADLLENIIMAENLDFFMVEAPKANMQTYIIYKFLNDQDENGCQFYEAVTIINNQEKLLFTQNFQRFIVFDNKEEKYKIQKTDLTRKKDAFFVKQHIRNLNKRSDYFFRIRDEELDSLANSDAAELKHKDLKSITIDLPIEALENKWQVKQSCSNSSEERRPVMFGCDNSILVIVDNYIVKKFFINDENNTINETVIVPDWDSLMSQPSFSGPKPNFYYQNGIVFNKHQYFHTKDYNKRLQDEGSFIKALQIDQVQVLPVNYDIEQLQTLEIGEDDNCHLAEYQLREGKRYKKRKRVVFNFTYFNWLLISNLKIIYQKVEIPRDVLRQACFDIFPNTKNILFYINDDYQLLSYVYSQAQLSTKSPFYIPFLKDSNEKTPVHYCLSNAKITDQFLNFMADYPISYYTSNLTALIPYFILKGLQKTNYFIDSRFKPTPMMLQFDRERLKILPDAGFSLVGKSSFWFEKREELANDQSLFDEDEFQLPIQLTLLDIPRSHQADSGSMNIFTALRATELTDIFESQAIRAIIEYSWPKTRTAIIRAMMIPNIIFLICYVFYITVIFEQNERIKLGQEEGHLQLWFWLNKTCQAGLMLFVFYFFGIELQQASKDLKVYINDIWNYLDLLSNGLVLLTTILDIMYFDATTQRPLFAITTLAMWIKTLYYIRIFRSVGYLTSMIVQVMMDMRYFFIILVMIIFAFGNTFYILSLNNPESDQFISSFPNGLAFTFNLVLGEFDTSEFGTQNVYLVWIFFLMASVLLIIVLLNLLISIISDSYHRIQSNARNSMYRELATLIDDNDFLAENVTDTNKYIIVAKPHDEYIDDMAEEKAATKHGTIKDTMDLLSIEMADIKLMLQSQQEVQQALMAQLLAQRAGQDNKEKENEADESRQSIDKLSRRVSVGPRDAPAINNLAGKDLSRVIIPF